MKTNLTQSEQFKILWDFIAQHGGEVEARGNEELSPDQKASLRHLASGKAEDAARGELIPLLRSNKNALAFLGEQMKVLRPGFSGKSDSK